MKIFICLLLGLLPLFAEKPNIVLIFCDDLGYGDLGSYGAREWETPVLDKLAGEGVRFTDFHVAQPVCSASRAALLTGCYPNRIGIQGALSPSSRIALHPDEITLGELCQSVGYATAIYGKWHLGHTKPHLPVHHGFDDYLGYPYSNDMWPSGPVEFKDNWPPLPLIEDDEVLFTVEDQTYLTKQLTQRALRFIKSHRDKPFLLYLAHPQPHVPLYVSPDRKGSSKQGLYGDVIQEIDWSTGEILKALAENGLTENTWVIFTSDNGPWMTYGNHGGSPGQLRGSKGTTWEGGVRVPCVMRWPGKIPAGQVNDTMFMTIDLFPTIAGIIGAELPPHPIDGVDAWPIISGKRKEPVQQAYYYWYNQNELHAMRMGKWKLVFPHRWRDEREKPGRDGMRGTYLWKNAGLELYDLTADPGESNNVAADHSAVVGQMRQLADGMRGRLGDRLKNIQGSEQRKPGLSP